MIIEYKTTSSRHSYVYDTETMFVEDKYGNRIKLTKSTEGIDSALVGKWLREMFQSIYSAQNMLKSFIEDEEDPNADWVWV